MEITLKSMITLLAHNEPLDVFQELLNSNDDFREFIKRNKDKSTIEMIEQFNLNEVIRDRKSHA